MFALEWEYLTGRYVARAYNEGQSGIEAEWPPHPDRVFQALVAAWGSLGEPIAGAKALKKLERLDPPEIYAPDVERPGAQTVFVPTNDKITDDQGCHKHMPRTFPSVLLPQGIGASSGDYACPFCALVWRSEDLNEDDRDVLETLCNAVTNIGHSQSFVRMWVSVEPPVPNFIPLTDGKRGIPLRVPRSGRFDTLCRAYAGGGAEWRRPPVGHYQAYTRRETPKREMPRGVFDSNLIVLRRTGGEALSLLETLAFAEALRGALLSHADDSGKELISGHRHDGTPSERPHVAYLPLPFAGYEHADGHLLGFALALPRGLSRTEEDSVWGALANAIDSDTDTMRLVAGSSGGCDVTVEERPAPPVTLQTNTWCRSSRGWATVTPAVLDRLPPRRHQDLDRWAAEQIAESCQKQGLPAPASIRISGFSSLQGVPPAREFPCLKRKDGLRRWHTHARIEFRESVAGPLILGAGRFRGYGLFKPVSLAEGEESE